MGCHHKFRTSGVPDYDICPSCGTYYSRAAKPLENIYVQDYWAGGIRASLAEQVWNVDMHIESGVSKNRFVMDHLECERRSALDIGCAPGRLLFWLTWAGRFKRVVGLDPSNAAAIRKIGCFDGEVFEGFFPAATRLLPNAEFDYIAGLDVFEHSFEPEGFLDEAKRLLRPEGQLFLMLPLSDMLPIGNRFFNATEHVYLHSECNMLAMLKDAGFDRIKFDRWTIGHETVSARKP